MKAALVKERERLQKQAEAGRAEGLRAAVRILAVLVLVLALRQRPYKRLGSSSPWAGTEARSVQRTSRRYAEGSCNWPKCGLLEFGAALGFRGRDTQRASLFLRLPLGPHHGLGCAGQELAELRVKAQALEAEARLLGASLSFFKEVVLCGKPRGKPFWGSLQERHKQVWKTL